MRTNIINRILLSAVVFFQVAYCGLAEESYFEVTYPPSRESGELTLGVTYRIWIPEGVKRIRSVIVHQHGCGEGSNKGAVTGAKDLHWQALAKKWDSALLVPAYHQAESDNCRLWCDPRNGSNQTFLKALADLAKQTGHAELEQAPWCLWGHSGGGFWSSLMLTLHPQRIVAVWFRSGSASVPGVRERSRHRNSLAKFTKYRSCSMAVSKKKPTSGTDRLALPTELCFKLGVQTMLPPE